MNAIVSTSVANSLRYLKIGYADASALWLQQEMQGKGNEIIRRIGGLSMWEYFLEETGRDLS